MVMTLREQRWSRWSRWLGRFSARQVDLALALLVTLAGLILFAFAGIGGSTRAGFLFLQNIEQRSLDMRFAARGERPHDERIVIVGIDEKTLQNVGAFPLPRTSYALLVNRLTAGGAGVIAFDATFPTPENNSAQQALTQLRRELGSSAPANVTAKIKELEAAGDHDEMFAAALQQSGRVVLGHLFLDRDRAQASDAKRAEEYLNIVWAKAFPQVLKVKSKGRDFDLSRAWLENGGNVYPGAEANLGVLAEAAASYGFFNTTPDPDGTLRRALLIVRYQDQDFFPSLAMQTLREYEKIPDQQIAAYISENGVERIQFGRHNLRPWQDGSVLINYTGPYHTYQHYSMWDVLSGAVPPGTFRDKIVLVGGTALGIGDLRSTPFQKQDSGYMGVEVHANIIDNLLHSAEKGRSFLTRGLYEEMIDTGFILLFGLVFGFWFSRIKPLYSTISVFLTLGAFAWFIYFSFARWGLWLSCVIPAGTLVVNYAVITSFRMIFEEGEKRKIRKTFSQYLSPGVIALIEKDPQKYIRPGGETKDLTVMFSDIRGFTTLSEGLTADELVLLLTEGRKQISIGVGLNTGPVNVGNMGSAKRLAWTVMGDNVNLASRLEGITKEYRGRIVISEGTYRQIADKFVCRDLDKIRVKGKHQPVTIYELLDFAENRQKYEPLLSRFNHAMQAYRDQDWQEAASRLGEMLTHFPDDGPTQIFMDRVLEFMQNAPEADWDGVYVMKTK